MTLVVGFNPGGDSDLNNRLLAQYVEPELGQSIAVTNMAGSNSSVALTQYQSNPTDGYTILGTNTSALVNNYASGTCQYSYEDFEVIAVFGRGAGEMLFANKASGITSMEDLLEKSQANPNTIKNGHVLRRQYPRLCSAAAGSRFPVQHRGRRRRIPTVSQLLVGGHVVSASCRT